MGFPPKLSEAVVIRTIDGGRQRLFGNRLDHPPQSVDEPPGTFDAGVRPLQVAFRRTIGEHEQARRIGAIAVDDSFRIDDVLL